LDVPPVSSKTEYSTNAFLHSSLLIPCQLSATVSVLIFFFIFTNKPEAEGSWNKPVGLVQVTRISLKEEYMKIQRKRVEGSQQRIEDGVVYFAVFSLMQIVNVRTFVQRLADWVDDIACNKPEDGKYMLHN
jgi:hypothetical protein